jgi:hypothetical protein
MKTWCWIMLAIAGPLWAQPANEVPTSQPAAGAATAPATQPAGTHTIPDRGQLERELAQTLTNSVFTGSWQLLEGEGLSAPKPEKYTIVSAKKLSGDLWLITARLEFADKDVTVPLPLRIVWAGDTPIITVTDLHVPGIGKYSARVMIYRDLYSGAWFGEGHGGLLSGRISRAALDAMEAEAGAGSDQESDRQDDGAPSSSPAGGNAN